MRTLLTNRRIRLAMAAGVLALLSATIGSADRFGGQFPHTAGNWLNIGFTQHGDYRTEVLAATASWYVTPTCLVVFEEAIDDSELDFYTEYRSETWYGHVDHYPCLGSGCSYSFANLYLNSRTLAGRSSFDKQQVAAHEFGHGIGLAHPEEYDPPDTLILSIMHQYIVDDDYNYNTPQSYDVAETNGIYLGCPAPGNRSSARE